MKKLALTSLLAVFAVSSANAATNYFVGGSAAISTDDNHATVLSVAPEFGWKYDANWDLGVDARFGYNHKYVKDAVVDDGYAYGADLFARYHVAKFGGVSLLLKGSVGADFLTFDGDTEKPAITASIIPMVTYDLSESVSLYANLNFLGVYAGYDFEDKDWGFGAGVNADDVANTGNFQIGFTYNF